MYMGGFPHERRCETGSILARPGKFVEAQTEGEPADPAAYQTPCIDDTYPGIHGTYDRRRIAVSAGLWSTGRVSGRAPPVRRISCFQGRDSGDRAGGPPPTR